MYNGKLGIAITTVPSRAAMHAEQMQHIAKHTPEDAFIYVHNDTQGIGIAKSKNACIAALMNAGCQHLFLFDDDVYPIKDGWIQVFTSHNLPHLTLTYRTLADGSSYNISTQKTINGVEYNTNACGIVLYYTRECIERIGGMDISYQVWGHEHNGLSSRIYNAGLTAGKYPTPSGAMQYFYSHDHQRTAHGVYTKAEKQAHAAAGLPVARMEQMSKDWKPYKRDSYVLTALYNGWDTQRNVMVMSNLKPTSVKTLADSAPCTVVCFNNLKPQPPNFYKHIYSSPSGNLYNYRFIEFYRWLKKNLEYCEIVYLLDATDTEFIGDPHPIERGKVYINTERERGNLQWLLREGERTFGAEILSKRGSDIWNCGVIYGHAEDVLKLLEAMQPYLLQSKKAIEMSALNFIANSVDYCVPVKSGFKSYDKNNVYIRHK